MTNFTFVLRESRIRSVAPSVVEPLEQLGRHFEGVRRGDLERRASVTSNDEIGELAIRGKHEPVIVYVVRR